MSAQVGESPTLHFTVESQPPLPEDAEHTLKTEDGMDVKNRFSVQGNTITFNDVTKKDSGMYIISCSNGVETGESRFVLEISNMSKLANIL